MSRLANRVGEICVLLAVVTLPLCFNPYATPPFEPAKALLLQAITIVLAPATCLAVWGRTGQRRNVPACAEQTVSPRWPDRRMLAPVLVYAAVVIASTLASRQPQLSLFGHADNPQGTVTVLCTLTLYVCATGWLTHKRERDRLVTAIVFGSVPVAVYGLAQWAGFDPLSWMTDSVSPVHSTLGRSNFLGAYLAMVIPFVLARVVLAQDEADRWRYGLIMLLLAICLFGTLARAAWLAFLGGTVLSMWLMAYRLQSRMLVALSVPLLIAGLAWLLSMNTVSLPFPSRATVPTGTPAAPAPYHEVREAAVGARLVIWRASVSIAAQRWLLGHGPQTFTEVFAEHRPVDLARFEGRDVIIDDPHNILLDHLVGMGIVGLLAFIWLMAAFSRNAFHSFLRTRDTPTAVMLAAAIGSATAFLIQAQFNPSVVALTALFWIVLALGTTSRPAAREV